MEVQVAYGDGHVGVRLPSTSDVHVMASCNTPGLPDPAASVRQALRTPIGTKPLSSTVRAEDHVAVVFSDITRPVPNRMLLEALLAELAHVPRKSITLINALGTHRPQTREELTTMLGEDILDTCRVVQHDASNPDDLVRVGMSRYGHPFWVNRWYAAADVRILTGLIEPHFFAGFSGGPKSVVPGIAGLETIRANHSSPMISSPQATWASTEQNPIWQEIHELARMAGPAFLLNVCINSAHELTAVFAGDLDAAHAQGVAYTRSCAVKPVSNPFDIVLTSNSGYPLDQNLYQCVKGMSAAGRVVKTGGHIIVAAECREGLPAGSPYENLLRSATSPDDLLASIRGRSTVVPEQWQVQVQVMVQKKATIHVRSDGLTEEEIRQAHLVPCNSIEETVRRIVRKRGRRSTICVIPSGPEMIPTLAP